MGEIFRKKQRTHCNPTRVMSRKGKQNQESPKRSKICQKGNNHLNVRIVNFRSVESTQISM